MKAKRLLSMVLALMLVVGMIPLSASAAELTDEEKAEMVQVKMWRVLPEDIATNNSKEKLGQALANQYPVWDEDNNQPGDIDAFNEAANAWAATPYTGAATIPNTQNNTVYIAVKVEMPKDENGNPNYKKFSNDATGLSAIQVNINFDSTRYNKPGAGAIIVNPLSAGYFFTNEQGEIGSARVASMKYNAFIDETTNEPTEGNEDILTKFGNFTGVSAGGTNELMVTVTFDSAETALALPYPLTKTTWDFVVPFAVKASRTSNATPGDTSFTLADPQTAAAANKLKLTKSTPAVTGGLENASVQEINRTNFYSDDEVKVKVVAEEATLEDTSILDDAKTITLKTGTKTELKTEGASGDVTVKSGTGTAVTATATVTDKNTLEVTIPGDITPTVGTDLTVHVPSGYFVAKTNQNGLYAVPSAGVDATVSVVAALKIDAAVTSTGGVKADKVKVTTNRELAFKYAISENEPTADTGYDKTGTVGTGDNTLEITGTDLAALKTAKGKIWYKGGSESGFITIPIQAAPTKAAFDTGASAYIKFADEKITVPDTIAWGFGSTTPAVNDTANVALNLATNSQIVAYTIVDTSAQSDGVGTGKVTGKLESAELKYTLARPAASTVEVALDTQVTADNAEGLTNLKGGSADYELWVNETAADTDYDNATKKAYAAKVEAFAKSESPNPAINQQYIHVVKKAVAAAANVTGAFRSDPKHLEGKGTGYATLKVVGNVMDGDTTVTIEIAGDVFTETKGGFSLDNSKTVDSVAFATDHTTDKKQVTISLPTSDTDGFQKDTKYTLTVTANQGTGSSKVIANGGKVEFTPVSEGFQLQWDTADTSNPKGTDGKKNTDVAGYVFNPAVVAPAESGATPTPQTYDLSSVLKAYEIVKSVKVTSATSGMKAGDIKVGDDKKSIVYTPTTKQVDNEPLKVNVTLEVGLADKKVITADMLKLVTTASGNADINPVEKTYDGTTDVPNTWTVKIDSSAVGTAYDTSGTDYADLIDSDSELLKAATLAFSDANASSTLSINGTQLALADDLTDYFTLASSLTIVDSKAEIKKNEPTGVELTVGAAGASQDAIVKALENATVKMTGDASGDVDTKQKLSDVVDTTDTDVKDALKKAADDAVMAAGYKVDDKPTVDLSGLNSGDALSQTAPLEVKPADTITIKVPDGETISGVTSSGANLTDNGDGTYSLANGVAPATGDSDKATITVTTDKGTYTFEIDPEDDEPDYDALAKSGDTISPEVPASVFAAAKLKEPAKSNFDTSGISNAASIAGGNGMTVNKSSSGGGYVGPTTPVVTGDEEDYGDVKGDFVLEPTGETDEDGNEIYKITETPEVEPKKGLEFVGWSTAADDENKIIGEEMTITEDTTLYAVYRGYIAGDGAGHAEPARDITRAELAKMLVVAAGLYDNSEDYGKPTYKDSTAGWYVPYVAAAEKAGIIHGNGDGTFRPTDTITRQEAVVMIVNTFKVMTTDGATTSKVNDFAEVANWAQKYAAALVENGTITGIPDGTELAFEPLTNVSRGMAAVMINKYLGLTEADKTAIAADSSISSPFSDMTSKAPWYAADILFASKSVPATYYGDEITIPTGE